MAETNPIRDTYDALWDMLCANTSFEALFPSGTLHQVRYTSELYYYVPDPEMEELEEADYQRCRIVFDKATPATERSSSGSFLDVVLAIEVCTGSEDQTRLMAVCWAVYCAMLGWRDYVRDTVTYNAAACVFDVDARGFQATDQNHERNRGTKQWIVVWSTVVRLQFPTADL